MCWCFPDNNIYARIFTFKRLFIRRQRFNVYLHFAYLYLTVAVHPSLVYPSCTGRWDCGRNQFCGTECWTGNCGDKQTIPPGTVGEFCQPCDKCLFSKDSVSGNCGACPKPGQSDTWICILGICGINIDVSSIFLTYITCAKPAMLHIRDSLFRYRQLFQTRKSPNLNLLLNSRVHDAPLLLLSEIFGVCRPLELWPEHVLRHYLLDWQLRRRPVRKRRH